MMYVYLGPLMKAMPSFQELVLLFRKKDIN